jgi:hypothetical protein
MRNSGGPTAPDASRILVAGPRYFLDERAEGCFVVVVYPPAASSVERFLPHGLICVWRLGNDAGFDPIGQAR